uniref:RING-type domain-containing protein n=1 Tax=Arion vulgaris TaxID=1028688 RepID=A0A0B7A9U5_9EUPU
MNIYNKYTSMSSGSSLVFCPCEFSRWWFSCSRRIAFMFIVVVLLPYVTSDDSNVAKATTYQLVHINITYNDNHSKKEVFKEFEGNYGYHSVISSASGIVMRAFTGSQPTVNNYGCTSYSNKKFPSESWIALVERGDCGFANKIKLATKEHNASAIAIYNNVSGPLSGITNLLMKHDEVPTSIAILLTKEDGKEIIRLMELDYAVYMHLKPGKTGIINPTSQNSISKTSVLFVSISFIVLMIVSLAWLVFYYIQRFRYSHAKERLARRLACAAKKAITRIPQRTIKIGDKELDSDYDQCAVCIEPYKFHDVIRTLPCRHVFHKSCVDPWLLDQRSCPMCKMDILRAYGMQIGSSQESLHAPVPIGHVTILTREEPEASSSLDNNHTDSVNVALVSPTCLHFYNNASDKNGYNEQSDSLQGAVGGYVQSPSALNNKMMNLSRAGKSDKAESISSEMRALIGKGKEERNRGWKREEACNEDDEDYDIDNTSKDAAGSSRNMEAVVIDLSAREILQP